MAVPSTMSAIEISEPGGPEVLQPCQTEIPEINADQVLVKVLAAGVNRPDVMQREGHYPVPSDASPFPGLEIAGVVVACGTRVERWGEGDRVVALTHGGGYAEYCAVNAEHCLPWPDNLSAVEAATLPETCFTVQHNLVSRGQLSRGDRVLVHGGSSGIGATAIQVAKLFGAEVVVTAGTAEKCDFCRGLGADLAINYRTEDWFENAQEFAGDRGFDVVLDMVAGSYVAANLKLLGMDGRYVLIAFLLGPKAEVNFVEVVMKRLIVTGSALRPQSTQAKAEIAALVEKEFWPAVADGRLRSKIYKTFPLAEAAAAHSLMDSGEHMGKIALTVAQ
ncbi:MAG: NAD(P)H-quinone oxidoreductase [Pseudomonadota bacterium]